MTKRKVLAIIIALTLYVSICSCATEYPQSSETDYPSKYVTFTAVAEGDIAKNIDQRIIYNQTIMYDPDTMVMYTYLDGYISGTMSVLYNADGSLKLYSPNTKYVIFTVVAEGKAGERSYQVIMYDPDTMVMYTYLDGYRAGTMSVIYNADGTLKLYSPEH